MVFQKPCIGQLSGSKTGRTERLIMHLQNGLDLQCCHKTMVL